MSQHWTHNSELNAVLTTEASEDSTMLQPITADHMLQTIKESVGRTAIGGWQRQTLTKQ